MIIVFEGASRSLFWIMVARAEISDNAVGPESNLPDVCFCSCDVDFFREMSYREVNVLSVQNVQIPDGG